MNRSRSRMQSALLACLFLGGAAAGCTVQASDSDETASPDMPQWEPLPEGQALLGEFVAHVRPGKSLTFERIERAGQDGPGLEAQSIDSPPIVEDGVTGSGTAGTVELVTEAVNDPVPGQPFEGTVTLRHFFTRPLNHVFVQSTGITPAGHNAFNDDDDDTTMNLDSTFGLWKYTAPAATTPGVLGMAPDNAGTRDWSFENPDNASTDIYLRVVTALGFTSYEFGGADTLTNACISGTNLGQTASPPAQNMGFPFTLYGSATSNFVRFNRRGLVALGQTNSPALPTIGANQALPSLTAPRPAIFPFWDEIAFKLIGRMCFQVQGTAPNRTAVITWQNMKFATDADSATTLTFSAGLSEGTNQITFTYHTLQSTSDQNRANGGGATIGVQNSNNTATAIFNSAEVFEGDSISLVGVP